MRKTLKICMLWVLLSLVAIAIASQEGGQAAPFPTPFSGTWQYSEKLTPVLKIQVEKVYALSKGGKLRLQKLKDQKYGCHPVMRGTWRCSRQVPLSHVTDKIRIRLEAQLNPSILNFHTSDGAIEEIVDGEEFKSWRVHRSVDTELGVFDFYKWTWTPAISKIILKDPTAKVPTVHLNLDESLNISQQYSINYTVDKNRFEIYIVQAHFQKVQ